MLWPAPQPLIFPSKRTDPVSPPLRPGPAGGSGCPPALGGGDGRAGTARGAWRGPGCGRGAPSLGSCLPPHGAAAPPLPVPPLQCVQGAGLAPLARRQAAAPRLPSSLTSLAFFSPFWTFSASPFPRYEAAAPPADAGRAGGAVDRRPPPPLLRGQEEAGGGGGTRGAHGGGKGGGEWDGVRGRGGQPPWCWGCRWGSEASPLPGEEVAGHLRDTPAARLPRKFGTGSVLAGGDGEVRVGLCSPRSSSCPPPPPKGSAPSPALLLGQGTTTCRDLGISQPLQGEKRAPALRSGASPRETVREPSGGARAEPRPASPPCPRALGLGFVSRWEAGCR